MTFPCPLLSVLVPPLVLLAANPLLAQKPDATSQPQPQDEQRAIFARLDRDRDGLVTQREAGDDHARLFSRLLRTSDANRDGKLSEQEFVRGTTVSEGPAQEGGFDAPASAAQRMRFFIRQMDSNGDGKLDRDELPERMKQLLPRLDQDGDQALSPDEIAAFRGQRPDASPDSPGEMRPTMSRLVQALDRDGDGQLSAEEIEAAPAALARLDRNQDGQLTPAEFALPPAAGPLAGAMPQILLALRQADKNGDQKLSREEAPPRLRERFEQLDRNSDGQLTRDELAPVFQRLREMSGRDNPGSETPRRPATRRPDPRRQTP